LAGLDDVKRAELLAEFGLVGAVAEADGEPVDFAQLRDDLAVEVHRRRPEMSTAQFIQAMTAVAKIAERLPSPEPEEPEYLVADVIEGTVQIPVDRKLAMVGRQLEKWRAEVAALEVLRGQLVEELEAAVAVTSEGGNDDGDD